MSNDEYGKLVDALIERPVTTTYSITMRTEDLTPFLTELYEKHGKDVPHESLTIEHVSKDEWEISFEVFLNND